MYWFDKCPEDKVSQVGDLCSKLLGMDECECDPPRRQWLGGKSDVCLVRYDSSESPLPLLVQCWPEKYKTPEVRAFLKKLVAITGTNQIYEDYQKRTRVDMSRLR